MFLFTKPKNSFNVEDKNDFLSWVILSCPISSFSPGMALLVTVEWHGSVVTAQTVVHCCSSSLAHKI